jgi:hypothetical protein
MQCTFWDTWSGHELSSLSGQRLDGSCSPIRHWNGSDVTTFSDQISKDPVLFSALQVLNLGARKSQRAEVRSPAAPPPSHSLVSRGAYCGRKYGVGSAPSWIGQPVAKSNPMLPDAFDATDAGLKIRTEEAGIRCRRSSLFPRAVVHHCPPQVSGIR